MWNLFCNQQENQQENQQKDVDINLYRAIIRVLEKGTVLGMTLAPRLATEYSYKGLDVVVYKDGSNICIRSSRYDYLFDVGADITEKVHHYFHDQCTNKIQEILNDD